MNLEQLAKEKAHVDSYILIKLQKYIEVPNPQNRTEFDFYMNRIKADYPNLYKHYVLQTLR